MVRQPTESHLRVKVVRIDSSSGFEVLAGTGRSQAAMTLAPGHFTGGPNNRHERSDQWLYVISGEGRAILHGEEHALSAGDLLLIEAGEAHEIINAGEHPLETLNIYAPPEY